MKIRRYPNQNYSTLFDPKTGFFARIEDKGFEEPFWSQQGPELLDISITNWCDRDCQICYKKSSIRGRHMAFEDFKWIVESAADLGVYQIAIGGGNPNQHPKFIDFLKVAYDNGIVPNYSTNGRGLNKEIAEISAKYCGVVAVSAYQPFNELFNAITLLTSYKNKVNIHYVLDSESIELAIDILSAPPKEFSQINAIVFLNYKPIGRSISRQKLLRNSDKIDEFFKLVESSDHCFKIGFDSCSVSGVLSKTKIDPVFIEPCDAGRFSMYISECLKAYPCSFQHGIIAGDKLSKTNTIMDVWTNSPNFIFFRKFFLSNKCCDCSLQKKCLNGCPIFDEICLCQKSAYASGNLLQKN